MNKPSCITSLVCDHVWRDPTTGKTTILGVFNSIKSGSFPRNFNLSLYFELTNGHGETPLSVDLIRVSNESVEDDLVASVNLPPINFKNPRDSVEMAAGMTVNFTEQGEYRFQIKAHGDIIHERKITVLLIERRAE